MMRESNSLIADMEKVLEVWTEDQTNHDIPLRQSLIQIKANLLQFSEDREVKKLQKKSLKLAELVHEV